MPKKSNDQKLIEATVENAALRQIINDLKEQLKVAKAEASLYKEAYELERKTLLNGLKTTKPLPPVGDENLYPSSPNEDDFDDDAFDEYNDENDIENYDDNWGDQD